LAKPLTSTVLPKHISNVVIIRKAEPNDASALMNLTHESFRIAGFPDHWIDKSDLSISEDLLSKRVSYVAGEGGDVLGFYVLTSDQSRLDQLCVGPLHCGTGVGKELFLHAKEMIAQKKSAD